MEKPKTSEGMLKIPSEVTCVRLVSFSFVPVLRKLPAETKVIAGEKERQLMRKSNEGIGRQQEAEKGQTMSGDGVFKAEFVRVGGDADEGDPRLARDTTFRKEAHSQLKLLSEHMTQGQLTPPQITSPSEGTAYHIVHTSPATKQVVLETANDKQCPKDIRGCDASFGSKGSPDILLSHLSDKRKIPISDHVATHSTELLETPTTSRESVLSEDWFSPQVLSTEGSLASLSRTISPCSSVRSGAFTPSVIRVKRHSLAPGSSLAINLPPCLSPGSSSSAPSPCPLSPRVGRAWQRPPPTQLALLTAILRKGRLPVLSSIQQMEYSPCWPIGAVSLRSCRACKAAAKLDLICPGIAKSKPHSLAQVPQKTARHTPTAGLDSQPPLSNNLPESTTFGPAARLLRRSHEFASLRDSADPGRQRVTSLTRDPRVTSETQKVRATCLTQQLRVTSPTEELGVTSPTQHSKETCLTQQLRITSPTEELGITSPTQHSKDTCLTQQLRVTSPTEELRVTSLTQHPKDYCMTQQLRDFFPTVELGVTAPTQPLRDTSGTQQGIVISPSSLPKFTSLTQQSMVTPPTQHSCLTQDSHAALLVSPSTTVRTTMPAIPNLPLSLNPEKTQSPLSNLVSSSSFLKLRSLHPKSSSPSPYVSGECSSPSPKSALTCPPEPKLACIPESKLCCPPEPKLASTPKPKLTCSSEPKLTYTPQSEFTCTPKPKFSCTPEPKLSCTSEPKFTFTAEARDDDILSSSRPSPVPKLTVAPGPSCSESECSSPVQNSIKASALSRPQPPIYRVSPGPWTPADSPSPCASPHFLCTLSPLSYTHSSTPDRLSPCSSSATSSRDLLTPSPSLSPSSSRGPKSGSDRAARKRKYKIKSSYKALAAIPTNTLLLEQQAIDDEVEKEGPHRSDADSVTETRSEMCSPAQLRQQSEELYAAIDQVLQDPLPMPRSQSAPLSLPTLTDAEEPKRLTPVPKSPGRETKYATFQVQSYGLAEKHLTKPGVIRPVTAIPKLTEEEVEEDFPNPFRQQYLEEIAKGQAQMNLNAPAGHIVQMAEDSGGQGRSSFGGEDILTKDETTLLITEKQETSSPPVAEGTTHTGPSSFNAAQKKTQAHETHI